LSKKHNQNRKRGGFGLFKLQITLAQLCKNTSTLLCKHPNTSITRGRWGVGHNSFVFWLELHQKQQIFGWCKINEVNLLMLNWQWQRWLKCKFHLWWAQCWLINGRSWRCLKEAHVVVFTPCQSQHLVQWQQRCYELHHGFVCTHWHEHNVRTTHRVDGMCAHTSKDTYNQRMG
jgi:hypothetical protein